MSTVDAPGNRREPVFDSVDVTPRRDADGHSDSPSLDRNARIRAEMISEMIRESGQLRTSPFVMAAVLFVVFFDRAPVWPTALLIAGTAVFVIVGLRLRRGFEIASPGPKDAEAWGLRYTLLSALVGLVWGPALAGYFDPASYTHQAFLALLAIGSLFTALMHRALYPPAFVALAVPTALPLIAQFALSGDRLGLASAAIGALGLLGLVGWLRILHRRFRGSFALRFENTDLIERLEAAHKAAEAARQSAEAGDRTKSEFLATISHELRTPMNGIIGMSNLLLGTRLTAQQRSYSEIVKESADALLNLINDILDLTKLESGRIDLDDSAFDLAQTVEGAVGLMAERARSKGIELTCYISPDAPDIMTADAGRLRQILLNLLSNAIKFTEEGSVQLTVEPSPHSRSTLRFQVQDTGIGIDSATIPRLFRPFTQAGGISRRYGGTGLGLAISLRLTEAMGGEIDVESETGRGSRFVVDLPVRAGKSFRRMDGLDGHLVVIASSRQEMAVVAQRYVRDWKAEPVLETDPERIIDYPGSNEAPAILLLDGRLVRDWPDPDDLLRQIGNAGYLRRLMVVPVGEAESLDGGDEADFDQRLLLPLRRTALHRALSGLDRERTEPDTAVKMAPGEGVRLRVLVVDDVPVNQKLAVSIVELAGHEAVAVGSGREALQALRSMPYDLVLMDVEMPEMDGLDATRAIRRMPGAAAQIPIVAMTAHPGDAYVRRCMDAGMNDYLGKPLDAEHLSNVLGKHGGRQAGVAPGGGPGSVIFGPLADRVGTATAREVAQSFHEELPHWVADLRKAVEADDEEGWRARAHSIRGAAANMGCEALSAAAAAFSPGNREPSQSLDDMLGLLENEAGLVHETLGAELAPDGDN